MSHIVHGAKIKIWPNEIQRAQLDLWRRRCISLWNLLLSIEGAAYDGTKFRPELGWRRIWATILAENYETAHKKWREGYKARMGKRKGEWIPPHDGPEPQPPEDGFLKKVRGGRINGAVPGIFIWEDDLLKIMARLKKIPLTAWIGQIQSQAAQAVGADIVTAIKAMLRERKKGDGGQDTGFPVHKKQRYAAGSVYFANTQVSLDWNGKVSITNGIGDIPCGPVGNIPEGAKLGEARVFREGEQWWLSAQFRFEAPDPLPATDAKCGVKVAAANIYTVFDGNDFTQIPAFRAEKRDDALLAIKGRHATRKEFKSKKWHAAQAIIAKDHAWRRNSRADVIHKGSRRIVNAYGHIAIDTMDIKSMVKKDNTKGKKVLRKITAQAAMYDAKLKIAYKAAEAGRVLAERRVLFPSCQICKKCGKVHANMANGKRMMVCECGNKLQRQKNAAVNVLEPQAAVC